MSLALLITPRRHRHHRADPSRPSSSTLSSGACWCAVSADSDAVSTDSAARPAPVAVQWSLVFSFIIA